MALEENQVTRIAVPLPGDDDLYNFGSGYLVADGLVLTAAHVLERAPRTPASVGEPAEVACPGAGWQPATVAWVDAQRDVAVLKCPGLCVSGRLRWGRLTGSDLVEWGAVGFPRASWDESTGRQPEHAYGRTSPISERPAGRLALTVESRDPTGSDSPWAGLSGAAVFSGEYLIGVITTDPATYGRSLEGRRAEDFVSDHALAELLGDALVLEDVTGRMREPGLIDLRSTLRDRNQAFTGRDQDLAALSEEPRGRTVLTQTLTGLGGVGKSALALEYAHRRYKAREVDLAWWFVAEDRQALLASMAGLYGRLTGTSGAGGEAEQGAVQLRNWLERSAYRWLVVFDNAEPGVLDGVLPENGIGQVIITSRASDWPNVSATRAVGRLSTQEAVALFREVTGLSTDDQAGQVAEELGGLALAIEQAAAYIRQTRSSYGDYLNALRTDPGTIFDADLAKAESVAVRVWRRSLDRVTAGQQEHPAAVLLGIMSYLAPDDIPRQLFSSSTARGVPPLSRFAPLMVTLAIGELAAYSLVGIDRDSGAITVHRVIHQLTRLDAASRGHEQAYCAAAIGLLDAAPGSLAAEKIPPRRLLLHVTAATEHAERLGVAPEQSVRVLNQVAGELIDVGQLDTARPLLGRALRISRSHLGPDHHGTLTARHNLALALGRAGRIQEAAPRFEQLLADQQRVLGPDDPDTLQTRGNLAHCQGRLGRPQEAVSQFGELIDDCVRVLGPNHRDTLRNRANLASWLGEAGYIQEAIVQLEQLLADRQLVQGPDDPDTLANRNNLAHWLDQAGRTQEAANQLEGLLADQQRVLGPDHYLTLTTRGNLASCLGEGGRTQEATGQLEQLVEDCVRVLGPDHPYTLATRGNLARWLGEAGRTQEAIGQLEQLLADQRRVLDADHPNTQTTRSTLDSMKELLSRRQSPET